MDSTWAVIWALIAVFAFGYISYLLYGLFYKLRNLVQEAYKLQTAAVEAEQNAQGITGSFEAKNPTHPDTLFQLLGQRRKRKRQIQRKKQDRQRRLINRISSIEIDERFR